MGLGSSILSEAAHALVDGSLLLVSSVGYQYGVGPGADFNRLLDIIRDFGTGKLSVLPDSQVKPFLATVDEIGKGLHGVNAAMENAGIVGWQLGMPFLRQVQELNGNLNEIQQRVPEVVAMLRFYVLVTAAVALALAFATVVVGILIVWKMSRRTSPQPRQQQPAAGDKAPAELPAPPPSARWGRRWLFVGLAAVAVLLATPSCLIHTVLATSLAAPASAGGAATCPAADREKRPQPLLKFMMSADGSTLKAELNEETLAYIQQNARGDVKTVCRAGTMRCGKSTCCMIAGRALDVGPCRNWRVFETSNGVESHTKGVDAAVIHTGNGQSTQVHLDFEGFGNFTEAYASLGFALSICDSVALHLSGNLGNVNGEATQFLSLMQQAIAQYNSSGLGFREAACDMEAMPVDVYMQTTQDKESVASLLRQRLNSFGFANTRKVHVFKPAEGAERELIEQLPRTYGLPVNASPFVSMIADDAMMFLSQPHTCARTLGTTALTGEQWVARARGSVRFIHGNVTGRRFADDQRDLFCEMALRQMSAHLTRATSIVAAQRRRQKQVVSEEALRSAWQAEAPTTANLSEVPSDSPLRGRCDAMATRMLADGWTNVKLGSERCGFHWWHNESEWGTCLNRQQINPGTCTWDCLGVAEHHVVGCPGNGKRTRPCCDERPHIVYGEWGPACNGEKMTQRRTAECQACGKKVEGCERADQPTERQCQYRCVNPAAVSAVSIHGDWAQHKKGKYTCVQSLAFHSPMSATVSKCCKGADEVHHLDTANAEFITSLSGFHGMILDWFEAATPNRTITKGHGRINFSHRAPPGKCLGTVPLSYKYWNKVKQVCVTMAEGNIGWVDQYIECDELRHPTINGRDLTRVEG